MCRYVCWGYCYLAASIGDLFFRRATIFERKFLRVTDEGNEEKLCFHYSGSAMKELFVWGGGEGGWGHLCDTRCRESREKGLQKYHSTQGGGSRYPFHVAEEGWIRLPKKKQVPESRTRFSLFEIVVLLNSCNTNRVPNTISRIITCNVKIVFVNFSLELSAKRKWYEGNLRKSYFFCLLAY